MLITFQILNGKVVEAPVEQAQVFVYVEPDDKEKSYLINQIGLDEHTFNSALDIEELARLEFETSHMAAIVKRPKKYAVEDNFFFKVSSLGLFLFPEKLIIVTGDKDFGLDGRIFNKIHSLQDLFLKVIFSCIWRFEEHLRTVRKISEELESVINRSFSNKDLLHLFQLEKSLVYYLDAINSNNTVIEKLKSTFLKLGFAPEVNEFLDDVSIEGVQCYKQAETYSEVLASMMDARASIINNNLNIRIKTLTLLSLCIMLPTLVVSVFSMNVPLPIPQHDNPISFWIVMGLAAFSVCVILTVWRIRRW
jgi:magnesium transporter